MTSPRLPCALSAALVPGPRRASSQPRGRQEASAASAPGASRAFGLRQPLAARCTCKETQAPRLALAGRCHNNRAPAAGSRRGGVTSGGLAVVGTRDPGSVLTGQTAEKGAGRAGGGSWGARARDSGRARSWQGAGRTGWPGRQAAEARGPQGSGASRAERRAERRERSPRRRPRRGWMATGAPGAARRACRLGPPWSPSAASGAAARYAPLLPALRLSGSRLRWECDVSRWANSESSAWSRRYWDGRRELVSRGRSGSHENNNSPAGGEGPARRSGRRD